jgi:hypothetical protein
MSINQQDMIFAVGEVGLLFLIIVLALVAQWVSKREIEREIAQLPVYQPKLHGLEGPATNEAAQDAELEIEFVTFHTARQHVETLSAKERKEIVEV